jgi:hypothetical protein
MHILRCGLAALILIGTLSLARSARADALPPPAPTADSPPPPPPPQDAPASAPVAAPPGTSSSLRLTYESTKVDGPAAGPAPPQSPDDYSLLHGFRLGYGYVMNYDQGVPAFEGKSLKDKAGLRSPHHFLIGYEIMYRVVGHSWLNVLLLGNVMIAGLEQSKLLPSTNLLIGFEIKNTFQVGVGANLSPLKGSEGHTIVAAGWTPRVGTIYTPVHFFFIPDVDGVNRMGVTTGVTF